MPLVRVIKKIDRQSQRSKRKTKIPPKRNQLSTVVKAWVSDFHKERVDGSATAAFDSLFSNTVPEADKD